MKQELIEALCKKSFQYSREPKFRLVSGKMSRYYINCRPLALSPRGMYLIGHILYDAVKDLHIEGIGGMTFGADPMAVATAFVSELKGNPIKAFSIRKTQKEHGIVKWIEGDMHSGERVVIIEDVVTTGGSTIRAIERARAEGLEVVRAIVLVDRQEGGLQNIAKHVKDVFSIVSRDELLETWKRIFQAT
ncbi:MAG: orotate phosphoribosyltransferase [Deltaproteobacteria bacterium]|nr:orotate phosphoribosyltransferase [Deltaproteobacteria bacterium]MBW1959920.1 orotate phosphoribosyltransferase [Deltaproteobacteria bacterium]MBW1993863.1 orotate phosphoribosyltransferase [Deltaproteobacteria bacterium]MBW2150149.1 orotate phosphoribosyltransferase [Deltaproteobacteria bacterium]